MSGRVLWIWEEDECLALRAALAKHNAYRPMPERITQRRIATELGVTPATINAYFGGRRALGIEVALAVLKLTGIPVEQFSQRLADEIKLKHAPKQTRARPKARPPGHRLRSEVVSSRAATGRRTAEPGR